MDKRTRVVAISIMGLVVLLFLAFGIHLHNYIEACKPKVSDDIGASESTALLEEFDISLPPEAKITAFSFTEEEIIIRIEGVEDLPAFLTDSIYLGIGEAEAERLVDHFYKFPMSDKDLYTDLYGIGHHLWGFVHTWEYPSCPLDYGTEACIFLQDKKFIIEITKMNYISENGQVLRDIVGKKDISD